MDFVETYWLTALVVIAAVGAVSYLVRLGLQGQFPLGQWALDRFTHTWSKCPVQPAEPDDRWPDAPDIYPDKP